MSSSSTPSVLVVAAVVGEAAHVPEGIPVVITGIGKTAAAARLARALTEFDEIPDLTVLNIGTAGALRDGVSGLHVVGTVFNHDMNGDDIRALGHEPHDVLELSDSEIMLASGDLFVNDPEIRESLGEEAHLVDMEAYAVAWTAREFGREVVVVKHVSDNADEAAKDWAAAVDTSARELGAWVTQYLAQH
ncbi:nucleosidase [Nocardioides yefusunii]|uniref:Nucleosidase n=1 Tax=Nocardioides yefusunii TaxID=2500546 RepID=A0ABW1QV57_9ACTN|nr:nucleosidase [Nocardioides yefusunii]